MANEVAEIMSSNKFNKESRDRRKENQDISGAKLTATELMLDKNRDGKLSADETRGRVLEGTVREDYAKGETGEAAFERSLEENAPPGMTYSVAEEGYVRKGSSGDEGGGGDGPTVVPTVISNKRPKLRPTTLPSSGGDGGSTTTTKPTQTGTGFFRRDSGKPDDLSTSDTDESKSSGYSCYVATALNDNGYWNLTKKVRLLKWCMDTKPEGKLDTTLWRNGYCVFGKEVVAPHVHNKYIQWLSNGFYDSTVKNKNTVQAVLGKLFFYVPSYTIGLAKALTGNLKTIDRT